MNVLTGRFFHFDPPPSSLFYVGMSCLALKKTTQKGVVFITNLPCLRKNKPNSPISAKKDNIKVTPRLSLSTRRRNDVNLRKHLVNL